MPYFHHDGLKLHYIETGGGVPFFFQHGLGGNVRQPFGLFVAPKGFRLISMDSRGHGTTPVGDPAKLGLVTFADDLKALIDHLQIPRAIIGGISMGAAISATFALRYPEMVMGLVLSRPAWLEGPQPEYVKIYSLVGQLLCDHGPERGKQLFEQTSEYQKLLAESPDNANSLLRQFDPEGLENRLALLSRIDPYQPVTTLEDLARIKVPTLVISSRQDPVHPYEYGKLLASTIPGAEFHELTPKSVDKQRHGQDVQRHIADFLRRHYM